MKRLREKLLQSGSEEQADARLQSEMQRQMALINAQLEKKYSAGQDVILASMQAHQSDPAVQELVRDVQRMLMGDDQLRAPLARFCAPRASLFFFNQPPCPPHNTITAAWMR